MSTLNLFIPESINSISFPAHHRERCLYFLNLLTTKPIYDKRINQNDFIPLQTKYLRTLIGRSELYQVRNSLIQSGYIETDKHYIPGEKSFGYRLAERLRGEAIRKTTISGKYAVKVKQVWERHHTQKLNDVHQYIKSNLERLTINYDEALEYILNEFPVLYNENLREKINHGIISVEKIHTQDFFFVIDQNNRVHNNLTNLNSKLRKFLRIDEQKLIEIDVKNSQPFLFNSLIQSYYFNKGYLITPTTDVFLSYDGRNEAESLNLFKKLTSQGNFYDFLMNEFEYKGNRSSFKIDFFAKVFYGKTQTHYIFSECKKFRELFPAVMKAVEYYKRNGYEQLANQLQQTEAKLMIQGVCGELMKHNIPVLTIHDSVLTTKEYVKTVKQTIEDVIKKSIGVKPKLSIK